MAVAIKNQGRVKVLEVLRSGGHIYESDIYDVRKLYDADGEVVGSVMQLTLRSIMSMLDRKTIPWTYTNRYTIKEEYKNA